MISIHNIFAIEVLIDYDSSLRIINVWIESKNDTKKIVPQKLLSKSIISRDEDKQDQCQL